MYNNLLTLHIGKQHNKQLTTNNRIIQRKVKKRNNYVKHQIQKNYKENRQNNTDFYTHHNKMYINLLTVHVGKQHNKQQHYTEKGKEIHTQKVKR